MATTYEDFSRVILSDKRASSLDSGNIKLTYNSVSGRDWGGGGGALHAGSGSVAELYVVVNMDSFKGLCGCEWPSSKAIVAEQYMVVNNGQLQRLQWLNCMCC